MSGKTSNRKPDRRVKRTRDLLGDALIALMEERPFESITVQDILDRAGVGRSTFYEHFRDKNDLFLSDVEDFLEMMSNLLVGREDKPHRIAPLGELLAHVGDRRKLHASLIEADKLRDFIELSQGYYSGAIERRLAELAATKGLDPARRTAMAQAFAGAFLSLLSWWMQQPSPPSPREMDEMFHSLVWSGLQTSGPKD